MFQPLVARLIGELGRSVGIAFTTRYEALTCLRCGPYRDAVLGVAKAAVAEPGIQVLFDLMSAMSEYADLDVLAWCCDLLDDPRAHVVRGSMLAFNNMAVTGAMPASDWGFADEAIVSAYNASRGDAERHAIMSELLVCLPPRMRRRLADRVAHPLKRPDRLARFGEKSDDNGRWTESCRIAFEIAGAHALPDRDLLTRFVFELIYDHRDTRSVTTMFLILATPIAGSLAEALFEHAMTLPHSDRELSLERLMAMQSGHAFPAASEWPRPGNLDDIFTLATLQAQASQVVPDEVLDLLSDAGGRYTRRAHYIAGLLQSPWLRRQADDPRLHSDLRAGVEWWIAQGGVVRT